MNGRIEIREAQGPGGPVELVGYAATFGEPYPVGSFTETIIRGAFGRTLGEDPDVSLLINHTGTPLARTTSGTMTLSEDARGLLVCAELEPSDPDVAALVPKLKRGDLSEMSFAFRATQQEWSEDKTERSVRECSIHRGDVSIVTNAANPRATASLRDQDLSLEQRERIAARVGERVCGPYSPALDLDREHETVGRRVTVTRSYLEVAKAKRLRRGPSRRSALAKEPHVAPRYTYAETQALGKEGKARKKPGGGYDFPIVDGRDVADAVHAIGRTPAAERLSVKRWVIYRAKLIGAKQYVPHGWIADVEKVLGHT